MLYLMIEGTPKCQSEPLLRAEDLLREADPDLYEVAIKVTCAYPGDATPKAENVRVMAVHTLRRVLGQYTAIEWVGNKAHAAALADEGHYSAT
jgi:hypothetical protein